MPVKGRARLVLQGERGEDGRMYLCSNDSKAGLRGHEPHTA